MSVVSPPPADRYRRLRLLGEGGSGQVWLVEDGLRPGTRAALKQPGSNESRHADALRAEFSTLARLRHPGVVEAFDFDAAPTGGTAYFTQEYVDGRSLAADVADRGPGACLDLAAEALRVLAFLHDLGLIHRDLKPDNLIVRRSPRLGSRLVLIDLGLATADSGSALLERREPVGTLPYVAPELLQDGPATPRSDLYGLGAVFYEVLHGQPPFSTDGRDVKRFLQDACAGRRPPLRLPAGYPEGFGGWLDELLSPDPAGRPAGALEALARLSRACGRSYSAETAATRAARLASDPVPGREAEYGMLWEHLQPTAGPRVVWLAGAAGLGKSRMLGWLRTEAIRRGWHAVAPPAAALSDERFLAELRENAQRVPTLLLLDELEGGEARTIQLVDRIARQGKAAPLQVVAALRPAEVSQPALRQLLDDTLTVPTLRRVDLEPLDRSGIRAMAERATGVRGLSESRLRQLARASEGNPLVAEALLVEDSWDEAAGRRRSRVLERSVIARVNLLSGHGLTWLESLVVQGGDVPESAVAQLSGLTGRTAREAAEETRRANLAHVDRGRCRPTSRLVVNTVLSRATPERRRRMHRRAAELHLSLGEEGDSWRLARLWSAAEEPERALECAVQAARQAERDGAPDDAAERYAYALRQCRRDHPSRLELRRLMAEALLSAGRYSAAVRSLGAALRLSRTPKERASLLAQQAQALVQAGRFGRGRAAAEEARELASKFGFDSERAQALKAMGMALGRLGREREGLLPLQESLGVFAARGDVEAEAEALQILAALKARLRRDDAEPDFRRAIESYRRLGHRGSELKSLLGLASIQIADGRLEAAEKQLLRVRYAAAEHGHLDLLETALSKLASIATEDGRLDRAKALSEEALDHARHLGNRNRLMVNRCRLAEVLIGCGRPAAAVDLLRSALEEPLEQVEPDIVDSTHMLLANALLQLPTSGEAEVRASMERSLEGFRRRRKARPLLMALVLEMERRVRFGREPIDPVRQEFDAVADSEESPIEPEIRVRAALVRTTNSLAHGDSAAAERAARAATEIAGHAGRPAYAARAHALLGIALDLQDQGEAARQATERGRRLLEEAARRIGDRGIRQSFMDRPEFRELRERSSETGSMTERRLLALYEMIRALNSETDPEALLESILDMALRAVSVERGMILLRDESTSETFNVRAARNLDRETLVADESFSRGIVAQAGGGNSILALDAATDERFRSMKSVSLHGIRTLMCVPLRSRGSIIGTVYLDSQQAGRLLNHQDLRFVEAFADHAALALENLRERTKLVSENRRLQQVAETRLGFGNLIGRAPSMLRVFDLIEKTAASDLPVLIQGESGTGKELVARAIHFNGPRRRRVFLTENCAAIPETLLESELFGHVRGAFTGADRDRQGLFEQADGGTLFLDEVGDMSPGMQARLLRVLQEGELRRVGGNRPIQVDVRVLAATHRDLPEEVEAGKFREDLLYRLQVLMVSLPPLRDRPEDIPLLTDHLLDRIAHGRGRRSPSVESGVRELFQRNAWRGNVRQLENILQRLTLLAGDGPLSVELVHADESSRRYLIGSDDTVAAPVYSLENAARDQLRRALEAAGGNRERAAKLMGVSRATIYRKIRDFGLAGR